MYDGALAACSREVRGAETGTAAILFSAIRCEGGESYRALGVTSTYGACFL